MLIIKVLNVIDVGQKLDSEIIGQHKKCWLYKELLDINIKFNHFYSMMPGILNATFTKKPLDCMKVIACFSVIKTNQSAFPYNKAQGSGSLR